MTLSIIFLAIANFVILVLLIKTMSDLEQVKGFVNSLMVITYINLRKEGKTTGDLIKDIIEVANEMAEKEGSLL